MNMNFTPGEVHIHNMKINNIDQGSRLGFGSNYQSKVNNRDLKNQGFGQQYGDHCRTFDTRSIIDDRDVSDAVRQKGKQI